MHFIKMQGCGNDYVFVDGFREQVPKERRGELARRISDRHFGAGADGLIFIQPGKAAPFEMEMYNADGSRAQMCGNGIRCVAKYVRDRGMASGEKILIESAGLVREAEILETDGLGRRRDEKSTPRREERDLSMVRVDMGCPEFLSEREECGKTLFCVSMGNPHAVVLLDPEEPWEVEAQGPVLERAPCFPERTNVEFVKVESRGRIRMRVWERGSGETLACGSGACAAAAVCMQKGLTDEEITVKLLGGELQIARDRGSGRICLTGPAVTVYEGEFPDRYI